MDTVNAETLDLTTHVTELLTMVWDIFATGGIGGDEADDLVAQGLAQYAAQVEMLATAATAQGQQGLQHICCAYRKLLEPLAGCHTLSEEHRVALEEWPTLVLTYLDTPTEPDLCLALLAHLQYPIWPVPLAAEDAAALQHVLLPDMPGTPVPAAIDAPPPGTAELPHDTVEIPHDTVIPALEDSPVPVPVEVHDPLEAPDSEAETVLYVPSVPPATAPVELAVPPEMPVPQPPLLAVPEEPLASADEPDLTVPAETVDADGPPGVEAPVEAIPEDDVSVAASLPVDNAETAPSQMCEALASDEPLPLPASEALDTLAMVDAPVLQAADEVETLNTFALSALDDVATDGAIDDPTDDLIDGTPLLSSLDETEDMEAPAMDPAAQGLLDFMRQEVLQLAHTLEEALTETVCATEEWRQSLAEHTEDLERLEDGATAMGLAGLQQASAALRENLLLVLSQESPLSQKQRQLVLGWSGPIMAYLQRLHDRNVCAALVQYLADAQWPAPLSADAAAQLYGALYTAQITIEEADEAPPRQRVAEVADVSLTLPDDVNPALLDTLLQELPRQAADFSAAIQRLTAGTGTLADVDAAQRIAHSLKGAANTVGLPGVANLTHHLEDILLACTQQGVLPTHQLRTTLTSAADCLEAMSETVSGLGTPPATVELLAILQEVLDWANLIDEEGLPGEDEPTPPAPVQSTGAEPQASAVEAPQSATNPTGPGAPIATDLVDTLLGLTGEAMLLNGQLQDRLRRTLHQTRTVRTQNAVLQQLVWELEQLVDIRGVTSPLLQHTPEGEAGEFDPLEMEQYNELHTVSRRLLEAVTDALSLGYEAEGSLVELDTLLNDQRRVQRESEEMIMRTRMVPVKTIAPRLQRGIRQACRLTGKEVELTLNGGETLMDSNVLNHILDPLMHILRNAVDHGIEAPAMREAHGKPRQGALTVEVMREGNTIVLRCRDDGAGLDYEAIRRTALERGLIDDTAELPEEELGRLILRPGFSTRAQTTQVSGRGIGMDVVYTSIQALKGSLRLTSEARRGCVIELRLPVSLMSTHGLLVRSGKQMLALSSLGIEQILYPGAGSLLHTDEQITYQLGVEALEAVALETLLNLPPIAPTDSLRPALLVRDETGRQRVVLVQAIVDSLALVVKPLGRYVPQLLGIAGATILGDGSVIPVLDLPALLRQPVQRGMGPDGDAELVAALEQPLPVALVVDDSQSARRALADFVHDLGFEVHTAGDGLEAITSIERRLPDLLLVDLEMPRMNGLELAEHVRTHPETSHLPIIMITSRSTEKHRRNATRAGVDVYLVKPFSEDTLAEHIQQLLAPQSTATGSV